MSAEACYLLDTNILSDLVRNLQGLVTQHIARVGERHICTSIVAAAELRFGAVKCGSPRLVRQVEAILQLLPILSLEESVDVHYPAIRHYLESQGQPIGPNDLLIAAHARAKDCILVTANLWEFQRVPDLAIRNWLAESLA